MQLGVLNLCAMTPQLHQMVFFECLIKDPRDASVDAIIAYFHLCQSLKAVKFDKLWMKSNAQDAAMSLQ